ncbi:MAG: hypothetical protein ACRD3J_02050 [Thermoanaerobaculia bacterium]
MATERVDTDPGVLVWEQTPFKCRMLTHATHPRFEIRLYAHEVLIARKSFTHPAEASEYAVDHFRAAIDESTPPSPSTKNRASPLTASDPRHPVFAIIRFLPWAAVVTMIVVFSLNRFRTRSAQATGPGDGHAD